MNTFIFTVYDQELEVSAAILNESELRAELEIWFINTNRQSFHVKKIKKEIGRG